MNTKSLLSLFCLVSIIGLLTGGLYQSVSPALSEAGSGETGQSSETAILSTYAQRPLSFEPNLGQSHTHVDFISRGPGYSLFLTPDKATLVLRHPDTNMDRKELDGTPINLEVRNSLASGPAVLQMRIVGANAKSQAVGLDELPGKVNYLTGNDPTQWQTGLSPVAKVKYKAVYDGIDLVYYGNQEQLEYDFIIAPHADPTQIVLHMDGAEKVEVSTNGDLILKLSGEQILMGRPSIYQIVNGVRRAVTGSYLLNKEKQVRFSIGAYDQSRPLIIDPTLVYSVAIGGSNSEYAEAIAVDSIGNAYVTGRTVSSDFPTTPGAFQATFGGSEDAFVIKLDPTGFPIYTTYLGGSNFDVGLGIAVDASGNAYVTGYTRSTNFPSVSSFQHSHGGGPNFWDAFVTKLDPNGTSLVYSTYLGGQCDDRGFGMAVDAFGNIYLTGETGNCFSNNFPVVNAFQSTFSGHQDVFVTKMNASGTTLAYSTFLGGPDFDVGRSIALDVFGNAYVTGMTQSSTFPTVNAFQTNLSSAFLDAFVTKIDPSQVGGASLIYSSFLGGSVEEQAEDITVDFLGNVYLTGQTGSSNFPTTPGAFQIVFGGGSGDVYVAKVDPTQIGSASLVYSTYLGGNGFDRGLGIAVDPTGNAHVTGQAGSNFPIANAFQVCCSGFVTKLNTTGSGLIYSSYLTEISEDIGIGATDNAYVTGRSCCYNAFIARISPLILTPTPTSTATATSTPTNTATTTPTNTPTNTPTDTPTSTSTSTQTYTPTNTPTNTPTDTPTPTNTTTDTPTSTPTDTHTPTSTNTPTSTPANAPTFTSTSTATAAANLYNFTGFFQPVDNLPTVNLVNAGRAIPVKFSLGGYQGMDIFASGYPSSSTVTCGITALDAIEETVTAGSSSLTYDASAGTYNYVWLTNKAWAGTCRTLVIKLNDGTYWRANFKFK